MYGYLFTYIYYLHYSEEKVKGYIGLVKIAVHTRATHTLAAHAPNINNTGIGFADRILWEYTRDDSLRESPVKYCRFSPLWGLGDAEVKNIEVFPLWGLGGSCSRADVALIAQAQRRALLYIFKEIYI